MFCDKQDSGMTHQKDALCFYTECGKFSTCSKHMQAISICPHMRVECLIDEYCFHHVAFRRIRTDGLCRPFFLCVMRVSAHTRFNASNLHSDARFIKSVCLCGQRVFRASESILSEKMGCLEGKELFGQKRSVQGECLRRCDRCVAQRHSET